jgi:ribokinase
VPDVLAFVVAGGLNTDIIAAGVPELVGPGELTLGGTLQVRAGGKSRNIATLLAAYVGGDRVAMVGRTCRDPFGLWTLPMDSLREAGVDTTYVRVLDAAHGTYPGVALIPVTGTGRNQIYVVPGVNADFSPADLDAADPLFARAARNHGMLLLSLEMPRPAVLHALRKARTYGLRVGLDPGGLARDADCAPIFEYPIDVLKPNEHETSLLTGVTPRDEASVRQAAEILRGRGVSRVLITTGAGGAWCCDDGDVRHVPAPALSLDTGGDETGCGDQAMAVLCAELFLRRPFLDASRMAVRAGTLQFTRIGVTPLSRVEVST